MQTTELERLTAAQLAQVRSAQEAVEQMKGERSREDHLSTFYLSQRDELEKKVEALEREMAAQAMLAGQASKAQQDLERAREDLARETQVSKRLLEEKESLARQVDEMRRKEDEPKGGLPRFDPPPSS